MVKQVKISSALLFAALLLLVGCSSNHPSSTSPQAVPVTVTMSDAPPAGVTVLDFSVQITGISLTNSNSSSANTSLLSSPITVNLSSLQTVNELVAKTTAPAGMYSGITITFGSASASVQNSTGQALTLGGTSCATTTVCQFTPTFNQMSSNQTTTPFPITLTAGQAVNIALDFNVASSLQADLSVTPSVSVTSSTTPLANGDLVDVSQVTGQVTAVGSNQFTLSDNNTHQSLTIATGTNSTFNGFTGCTAANSTCLAANQIVTVNFGVDTTASQTLTASNVSLDGSFSNAITGTIISTNPGLNTATVVVSNTTGTVSGVTNGQEITVTPAAGATFGVNAAGATIPAGLNFAQVSDLAVGQQIMFDGSNVIAGATPSVTTSQINLVPSQFTGTVNSTSGTNIQLNGLNGVFTNGGVNQLQVQTGTGTAFTGTTGVSALTAGNNLTVGGFLFNSQSGEVLVGSQVDMSATTAASIAATKH